MAASGLLDLGSKETIIREQTDFSPMELTTSEILDLGSMVLITGTLMELTASKLLDLSSMVLITGTLMDFVSN